MYENKDLSQTFYLTSLFSELKTDNKWRANEIKLLLIVFKELSRYKIYLPDILDSKEDELRELLKDIPRTISIPRTTFINILGINSNIFSREYVRLRDSLLSKKITSPSPFEPSNKKSERASIWFPTIDYLDSKGEVIIKINEDVIDKLVLFSKYTKINYENVISLKNDYSAYCYLLFKILLDSSKQRELVISIEEFKEKVGLNRKYSEINLFRKRVLDVVINELNEHTDINLEYILTKEGRSYSKIKFTFDYKIDKPNLKIENQNNLFGFDTKMLNDDDLVSPFESKLVSWGIRAKKVVQIESEYSLDAISKAVEETEKAHFEGAIKSTKAAFFMGVLENKEFESQKLFEEQQKKAIEEQQRLEKKLLGEEYDAIQSFIHQHESEISSYLSAKSMGAIFELSEDVKNELDSLKNVDVAKFKNFRPRLPVLFDGYFNMKEKKNISPNMFNFIKLIK